MIFGINTTSDISKLLYVISQAVRRLKFETILKYRECYLCEFHLQILLLFVYTATRKSFLNFHMINTTRDISKSLQIMLLPIQTGQHFAPFFSTYS